MSAQAPPPPLSPDEERRKKSTRLAIGILAFSGGCGCLFFVGAFVFGMVLGALEANKRIPEPVPVATDEEPMDLRLSE